MNFPILDKELKYHLKLSNNYIQITDDSAVAKHVLCSRIFKGFVLYFSLKFFLESSHLDSSDANNKAVW